MNVEIPYWHPLVAHFPIALLIFGAGTAAAYAVIGCAFWRGVTLLAFAAGTLGAWAAVWTGDAIYGAVEGTPIVEALVESHEENGEWALWLGAVTTLALISVGLWARRTKREVADPVAVRLVVFALALAAAALVARAGHLGGTMVWGVAG